MIFPPKIDEFQFREVRDVFSKPPGQPTISKVLFFKQQSPKMLYLIRL